MSRTATTFSLPTFRFGLMFSRLPDMASTGYISVSAIFSSSLAHSIYFSRILSSSGFFSHIPIHLQGLPLNILVHSAPLVYILLQFHRMSLKLVLFVNTGLWQCLYIETHATSWSPKPPTELCSDIVDFVAIVFSYRTSRSRARPRSIPSHVDLCNLRLPENPKSPRTPRTPKSSLEQMTW